MPLPTVVLSNVIFFADTPTRHNLMMTSKEMYNLVEPAFASEVYHTIEIGKDNIAGILEGLKRSDVVSDSWNGGDGVSRKLRLLDYCKTLIVQTLPSDYSWEIITDLVLGSGHCNNTPQPIFREVMYVCVKSDVLWELLLWTEDNAEQYTDHPFLLRLSQMVHPTALCVSLHSMNLHNISAFMARKVDSSNLSAAGDQLERLIQLFFLQKSVITSLDQLFSDITSILTIHNIYPSDLGELTIPHIRIFVGPHILVDMFMLFEDPTGLSEMNRSFHGTSDDTELDTLRRWIKNKLQHHARGNLSQGLSSDGSSLLEVPLDGSSPKTSLGSIEVVQPAISTSNRQLLELYRLEGEFCQRISKKSLYTAKVTTWEEAEPCVCCGKK